MQHMHFSPFRFKGLFYVPKNISYQILFNSLSGSLYFSDQRFSGQPHTLTISSWNNPALKKKPLRLCVWILPAEGLLPWKLNSAARDPFVAPRGTIRWVRGLGGIINSSSVIGISLEILWNTRSLTSSPCIFKTIYTYANEINKVKRGEDREWKLRTNYTSENQRVTFQLNSSPHLPSI